MPWEPGMRAGPYEVLDQLGEGAMAQVFRARDTRLGREVAIKVLPEVFSDDPAYMRRFEREARAVGMLNHPNILAVYDIGTHQGLPYIVTELLQGETLRARIEKGPLPLRKAVDFGQQVARGLAAAHEKGITHRDLKPENIFITRDGVVKVLDFGLAKVSSAGDMGSLLATRTESGVVLGTIPYMSPEQVNTKPTDHRSDIFSFGSILYEMSSGERAFRADTGAETMVKILHDEPPLLAVSPALDQVIRHCLEKRPDDRFQSAHDLGFALQALTVMESGVSGSGALHKSRPSSLRSRVMASLATAGGTALLAASFAAGHFLWRAAPAVSPAFHQVTFRRGIVFAGRFAPDGQTILYSARWDGRPLEAYSVRPEYPESRPVGASSTMLLSVSPSGLMAILRDARYLHHLQWSGTLAGAPMGGGAPRDLLEDVQEADWDPTATGAGRLAVVRQDGAVKKVRLEFPAGTVIYETAGWISHPRVSPNGKMVAILDHPVPGDSLGSVAVLDASGRKKTLSSGWAAESGLAWSPKGDEVWFSATRAGSSLSVYAVNLDGGLRLVLSGGGRLLLQDIARDGRLLVGQDSVRSELFAFPAGSDKGERNLSWLDHSFGPILSADGKQVLFTEGAEAAGPQYSVCLRDINGSPVVRLGEGAALGISANGKWALSVLRKPPSQLVLLSIGAGQPKPLERGNIETYGFGGWLPDGKRIAFTGNEAGKPQRAFIQEISGGAPRPILPEGFLPVFQAFSPDSTTVVCQGDDRKYMLCPLDGGDPRPLPGVANGQQVLRWDATGKFLYVYNPGELPLRVYKLDVSTGRRQLSREVVLTDRAGLSDPAGLTITPDGQSLAYVSVRVLSELYIVEGVR